MVSKASLCGDTSRTELCFGGWRSLLATLRYSGGPLPPPLRVASRANVSRVKSLILWGPTRTGKTLYARSLGHHAYFNLQFNMDEFSDDCQYAVFDDIQGGFEYFHSYKGWLGAQKQFVITDKYRKKRTIYWGKPSIMCMNEDPHFAKGVDYDWLMNNCHIINVVDPICIVSNPPPSNGSQSEQI